MQQIMMQQVLQLEYQALALVMGPLTSLAVGRLLHEAVAHMRDQRARNYAARLVSWAQQAIPSKSARYDEVAALLSQHCPGLSGEQLEVLIESEVLNLKNALGTAASTLTAVSSPTTTLDAPATSNTSTTAIPVTNSGTTMAPPTPTSSSDPAVPTNPVRVG